MPGLRGAAPRPRSSHARRACALVSRATHGNSWMEVRTGSSAGTAPVQRDARARPAQVVRGRCCSSRSRSPTTSSVRVNGNRVELPAGTSFVVTSRADRPGRPLEPPRAAIVVTGSELVRGERQDRNGPFLAAKLFASDSSRSGSRSSATPETSRPRSARRSTADLCLVSGGLGPTHDDRTVELVARVAGRPLAVDQELERAIGTISRTIADRLGRPYGEFQTGVRKQATLPEGALSLGLAGTAPGIVLDTGNCVVVVLPGPAPRAAAPLATGARDRAGATRARPRTGARAPRPPLLRDAGIRRGGGIGKRRRRRRRRRGDHLRPRVRDSRRPLRGAGGGGAGVAGRGLAPHRARPVPLRRGRALDRGDRPRPLPRAEPHARDRRVLHRGHGGRPASRRFPVRATSSAERSWRTPTR